MPETKFYGDGAIKLPVATDTVQMKLGVGLPRVRTTEVNRTSPFYAEGGAIDVIWFIHGLGASRDLYGMLAKSWGGHGYLVLRPDMLDSLHLAGAAAKDKWEQRIAEVVEMADRTVELLPAGYSLGNMALAGHSDGARSVLGALGMGLNPRRRNPLNPANRYETLSSDCGLLLSPPGIDGTMIDEPFGSLVAPIFVLTGDADGGMSGTVEQPGAWRRQAAEQCNVTSYLSYYSGGDHGHGFPFNPTPNSGQRTDPDQQATELDQCIALFDCHVRERDAAGKWMQTGMWREFGAPIEYAYKPTAQVLKS